MDDRDLLDEFVAHRSETAFRAITNHYLNLVYSTALRETNDPQLAQDVTQAVFILLSRKAASLPKNVVLAGWLYRTTHFVASRAVRSELRRQRREQEAFQMQQNSSAEDTWKNVAPLLDEALSKLRESDRDAILLRYFQNETLGKVGQTLGVSEAAAAKRVARALDALRGYFGRRGFSVTILVLAGSLAKYSAHAAPAQLGQSVVTSVFMHAPSAATAHGALVQQTLKAWQWTKAKWLAGLGTAAAVALYLTAHSLAGDQNVGQLKVAAQTSAPLSAPAPSVNANDVAAEQQVAAQTSAVAPTDAVFKFQAVDGVTGKGLAGARVLAFTALDIDHIDLKTNLVTDAQGRCDVPLVFSNSTGVAVGAVADGYEERYVIAGAPNEPVPAGWVLKLYRGGTIGGVVQDESGQPVANADISIQFYKSGDNSSREFQRERPGFPYGDLAVATTDASGRWQFRSAPETNGEFYVEVRHPQFPTASFYTDADERNYIVSNRVELASLHAGNAVMVLKSGLALSGVVTDEQQNPIAGAQVRFGEFSDDKRFAAVSDAKGAFTLTSLRVGSGHITISAKGFAPERLPVDVASDSKPVAVQLKPAALLRLRVVDEDGNGMPHVDVRLQGWRGINSTLDWGGFTDDEGRISWDSAPVDQLNLFAGTKGYFYSRNNFITADGDEHVIKMHKELTVSGWATDAATGQAITEFKAIPGTERHDLVHGSNGQYSVTFNEPLSPLEVTIEAEGYDPLTSDPFSPKTNQVVWNAQLKRTVPGQGIAGTILFPDGTPAAGAQVALCTSRGGVLVGRGKFISFGDSGIKNADTNGLFTFAVDKTATMVVAIHPRGFASLDLMHAARPLVIQLQPWGRIEGSLKVHGENNAGQSVALMSVHFGPPTQPEFSFDVTSYTAKTDDTGNFVFDQAPPGEANLFVSGGIGVPFSHQTPVLVPAGGTVQAQIGGSGSTVTGRFVLSDPSHAIDWPKQVWFAHIGIKLPPLSVPPNLTLEQRAQWEREFSATDEGKARTRSARGFPLNVSADGSFTVTDVPPGSYELNASFTKEPVDHTTFTGMGGPLLGSVRQDLIVPDQSLDAKEVQVGTVTVKLR